MYIYDHAGRPVLSDIGRSGAPAHRVELLHEREESVLSTTSWPRSASTNQGISRHLRILHEAGFRRHAPRRSASSLLLLRPEPFAELDTWVGRYRDLWQERLDRFDVALEQSPTGKEQAKGQTRKGQPR